MTGISQPVRLQFEWDIEELSQEARAELQPLVRRLDGDAARDTQAVIDEYVRLAFKLGFVLSVIADHPGLGPDEQMANEAMMGKIMMDMVEHGRADCRACVEEGLKDARTTAH